MTSFTEPSIRTERFAHPSQSTAAPRGRSRHTPLRLAIVAVALLGSVVAAPAAAQSNQIVDTMLGLQSSGPSSTGQAIVNTAMPYQGSPYVWGGNGPGGFDCSGFTHFVVLNAVGIDIGRSPAGQTGFGAWVDWGAWQPGDLVFFANTYGPGVSHTGIYIGDGQFIHAENANTGVTISSLYSDYYAGHYYGATRIG